MIGASLTQALSSALFHFLWQGALLTLIPALALLFRSPRVRCAAACVALFAMPVAFAITFAISIPAAGSHVVIPVEVPSAAPLASAAPTPLPHPFDFAQSMRWFVPFWIAGVILLYLRTFTAWIAVQRLRRASLVIAPESWRERLGELAERLGIRRAVALFGSELVDVPVVAGFLRPAIFVPAALFTGMPAEQLEYLLIHELAHIRRFDYAVNLVQKAVEGLLFYHPAVWWVSRILRTERENCCDDAVVEMRGNAREYAAVLTSLEESRSAPALAASGGNLGKRILRLLNRPAHSSVAPVLAVLAIAITATVAWAMQQQLPSPMPAPWEKWLTEDVVYIITTDERAEFEKLTNETDREQFVEQFWKRRDPTPDTVQNEFKEEHYRRIAFANAHFQASAPGWKMDRGRIYIVYGPPDEIDAHPSGGSYQRSASEGGGTAFMYPFEDWRYRFIEGIGNNVAIRYVDETLDGTYRMLSAKAAKVGPPVLVQPTSTGIDLSVALDPEKNFTVLIQITNSDGRPFTTALNPVYHQPSYEKSVPLTPGKYRLTVTTKDTDSPSALPSRYELDITVP